jgi:hypothetical protein
MDYRCSRCGNNTTLYHLSTGLWVCDGCIKPIDYMIPRETSVIIKELETELATMRDACSRHIERIMELETLNAALKDILESGRENQSRLETESLALNETSICHNRRILDLRAENAALREGIRRYGFHSADCGEESIDGKGCICGLAKLLGGGE